MPGQILTLDIKSMAHGGVTVARHQDRVVFVSDAIPGEQVRARVSDDSKAAFWRAETIDVITASLDRREHIWPEASIRRDPNYRPGGAEFGHILGSRQRALKGEVLREALQRMAHLDIAIEVIPVRRDYAPNVDHDAGTGWRTRVKLHVSGDGQVGPYAARSRRVIPVATLPLAHPELQNLAAHHRKAPGASSVELIIPSAGEAEEVIISGPQRRFDDAVVHESVAGRIFRVSRNGFWQVHQGASLTLWKAVQEAIVAEEFDPLAENLDLYGGVGLFAAAMGDRFGKTVRVTSVEVAADATAHAADNLADWIGARVITAGVESYLRQLVKDKTAGRRSALRKATVVIDPPRTGARQNVVQLLTELEPAQIIYVACDPVALARDTNLFRKSGYELDLLQAFDLFPNTHHLEAVARFRRW